MKRTGRIWTIFGAALLLAFVAMAWVSVTALRLDRAQTEAARQAFVEENVRLALWRLDSAAAPIVARESGRPVSDYLGEPKSPSVAGQGMQPGPLMTSAIPPMVRLHFMLTRAGQLTSPQVVDEDALGYMTAMTARPDPEVVAKRLEELRAQLDPKSLEAGLGAEQAMRVVQSVAPAQQAKVAAEPDIQKRAQQFQSERNVNEFRARSQSNAAYNSDLTQQTAPTQKPVSEVIAAEEVMRAVWIKGELVVARRVKRGGVSEIIGCWLDWPAIRAHLLGSIRDLLPAASLESVIHPGSGERLMAALPVRLVPGPVAWAQQDGFSPVERSLVAAWGCMVLAAGAVIVLLVGVMTLSERRAAFVSAVTHELRTPLTTFRMYSEMLDAGMVEGETRRKYVSTLRTEAERLGHLVENVLAYARLESGRARGRIEPVALGALVERSRGLLAARAEQADMTLVVEADANADAALALADGSAVEQILFNLVDNACKYAASAEDRRIHLSARATLRGPALFVCDHGPGIPPAEMRRVFRAFHKPSRDAANSAPGVGLGLSLSRRLARQMRGDLSIEAQQAGGACFVLTLPAAPAS